MRNGSTSIIDRNVSVDSILSNPHHNNGVSKVLGILLSDFVSRGSEGSLWRHPGHENKQLKSAQCQSKVSVVSGSQICKVRHSAGISGKYRDIGIDFSGIATCMYIVCLEYSILTPGPGLLSKIHVQFHVSQLGFSDMASDWLAAVLPANEMTCLKIVVN